MIFFFNAKEGLMLGFLTTVLSSFFVLMMVDFMSTYVRTIHPPLLQLTFPCFALVGFEITNCLPRTMLG